MYRIVLLATILLLRQIDKIYANEYHFVIGNQQVNCIIFDAKNISISFKYLKNDTSSNDIVYIQVPFDNRTSVDGNCGEFEQNLNITFQLNHDELWSINFIFSIHTFGQYFALTQIDLWTTFNSNEQFNSSMKSFQHYSSMNGSIFTQLIGAIGYYKSTKCTNAKLILTDPNIVEIQLSNYRIIAFKLDNSDTFSNNDEYELCDQDEPYYITIGIGVLLSIAFIVVVIAYINGRNRSENQRNQLTTNKVAMSTLYNYDD